MRLSGGSSKRQSDALLPKTTIKSYVISSTELWHWQKRGSAGLLRWYETHSTDALLLPSSQQTKKEGP
jgi:hypothetical protein